MLYICANFHEIILNGIKVIERTQISIRKITKGNNSEKNVGGVTVVNLSTLSGHTLYFYQFREIISNGIKVIERTPFLY